MAAPNRKKPKLLLWLIIILVIIIAIIWISKRSGSKTDTADNKNTINIAIMGEPASLDPLLVDDTWSNHVVVDLFTGLTERSPNGDVVPAIATSWTVSKDKKTYIFHLRKDAKWSDNTPVTAKDFEYSIKRALDPQTAAPMANLLYVIKGAEAYNSGKGSANDVGVQALNDYTLKITLKYPASYFLEITANNIMFPVPEHVVEKYGKAWSDPGNIVSDGAYKLVDWKPKAYIKAVKNDLFYAAKDTKIQNIMYYTQQDNAALLDRFRAKNIDMITLFPATEYDWLKANMPGEIKVAPFAGIELYALNLDDPKFKDPRVREALNIAVDRKLITSKIIKSGELPAYNFVPPSKNYTPALPAWKDESIDKRVAEAKKLLAEAGYNSNHPLSFTLSYNTNEEHKEIAVAVAAMWAKLGVEVQLYNKDAAVHYADIRSGKYEMARAAWVADYNNPADFVALMINNSADNWPKFNNPQYDKLFWEGMAASSVSMQMQKYHQAEKLLTDSNALIPIYFYVSRNLVAKRVIGWEPNPVDIHLTRFLSLAN